MSELRTVGRLRQMRQMRRVEKSIRRRSRQRKGRGAQPARSGDGIASANPTGSSWPVRSGDENGNDLPEG